MAMPSQIRAAIEYDSILGCSITAYPPWQRRQLFIHRQYQSAGGRRFASASSSSIESLMPSKARGSVTRSARRRKRSICSIIFWRSSFIARNSKNSPFFNHCYYCEDRIAPIVGSGLLLRVSTLPARRAWHCVSTAATGETTGPWPLRVSLTNRICVIADVAQGRHPISWP